MRTHAAESATAIWLAGLAVAVGTAATAGGCQRGERQEEQQQAWEEGQGQGQGPGQGQPREQGERQNAQQPLPTAEEQQRDEPQPAEEQEQEQDKPRPTPGMQRRAANCPSAVPGATTKIDAKATGPGHVIVYVLADEDEEIAAIRSRAQVRLNATRALADARPGEERPIRHTGLGTGGGNQGLCPIYATAGITLQTEQVPGGIRATLVAPPPKWRAVAAEVQYRINALAAWLSAQRPAG